MMTSYEYVASEKPFRVRRRVRWSECDPAGVVYAGRFTDYLLDTCGLFFTHIGFGLGDRQYQGRPFGLPAKHLSLTFVTSLYPEDDFDMTVRVAEIRTRTFDLVVTARLLDGRIAFEGKCSPICITPEIRQSIPIPDALRDALAVHLLEKEPAP